MFSEKDFERLWFLYKTEGEPNGVSINSFCIGNNIPYTAFYDWFKKTQKKVVSVEVEGIPEELIRTGNEERQEVAKDKPKRTTPHKGSIMVTIRTREGLCIQKKGLDYQGLKTLVEKLSINGLHNFYYLPELHDMRCKAQRICEIIRGRYHRDPLNGDVYMFMSKDQRKVRMIHYERNAYYLHEKSFIKGYKFMKIERKDDVTVYKIDWKDLVTILETPVITSIRI